MKDEGLIALESLSQAVWYNRWTIDRFKQYLAGDILEIGCGIGNFTKELEKFGNVWALDYNRSYVKEAKKLVNKKTKVGFGDIQKGEYFFKQKTFDTIVCINVLEHIENDTKALVNINKLLKKGGNLVLLVPEGPLLYGAIDKAVNHYRRYKKNKLTNRLEQLKLKILYARKLNFIGGIGWFISGRILRSPTIDKSKLKIFNLLAPIVLKIEDFIEPPIATSVLIIARKVK